MITELAEDLINKIKTVPSLQNRVGAAVGGTENDPTLAQAPLPYSWIIYGGSAPIGSSNEGGKTYRQTQYLFTVVVGISYGGAESEFLANQLPVLEAIAQAVNGTEAFKYADLWEYQGEELSQIQPDRMIYKMDFSIIGHHKTN